MIPKLWEDVESEIGIGLSVFGLLGWLVCSGWRFSSPAVAIGSRPRPQDRPFTAGGRGGAVEGTTGTRLRA